MFDCMSLCVISLPCLTLIYPPPRGYTTAFDRQGYLDDFSVTAACRGKGIGTKLIGMAEGYAASLGISAVVLHVEKANEGAHRLYSSLGYSDHEDQGNRILMVKELRK